MMNGCLVAIVLTPLIARVGKQAVVFALTSLFIHPFGVMQQNTTGAENDHYMQEATSTSLHLASGL